MDCLDIVTILIPTAGGIRLRIYSFWKYINDTQNEHMIYSTVIRKHIRV